MTIKATQKNSTEMIYRLPKLEEFLVLGFSAREGDSAAIREVASLPSEKLEEILGAWLQVAREINPEAGLFYLGTCHRIEIYSFGIEADFLQKLWHGQTGVPSEKLRMHQGEKAYEHLLRVATSLESEVLGETQITGQVREASERARKSGMLKGPLDRCLQNALRSVKKIRSKTRLGEGVVSVAHVAVDGLEDVFDSLDGKKALVVGAGSMAVQALERLQRRGVSQITWINRSPEKLKEHRLADSSIIENFSRLHHLVWEHSIVVMATSSSLPLLKREELKKTKPKKEALKAPRVVLDLGLPRNVEEQIHGFMGFYLRNVDEFSNRVQAATEERKKHLRDAEALLSSELSEFLELWQSWGRGPLISQLVQNLEILRKSQIHHLNLENNPEIEYLTRNIYAKLLHRLLDEIDCLDEANSTLVLETLLRAWRQPDRWPEKSPPLLLKLQRDLQQELQQSLARLKHR